MAIQNRRGAYRDFDPTKMVEGEWAVVKDGDPNSDRGRGVYMAFGSGIVERLLTVDDMEEYTESAMTYAEEAERQARVATEEADRAFSGTPEGYEAVVSIAQSNNLVGAEGRTGWKTIAANTDMNTLTTPDIYSASNNVAATLINSPIRTAFKLEVSYFYGNTTNRQQKIIPYAAGLQSATGTPYIEYIRRSTDSGTTWSDWMIYPDLSGVSNIYGAKNLLYTDYRSQPVGTGAQITMNDDGSITITGTTTTSFTAVLISDLGLPTDKYIISCEATGTVTKESGEAAAGGFYVQNSAGTTGGTRLISAAQNASVQVTNTIGGCWIYFAAGLTFTDFTLYPMIRHYSIVDDTYAPYAMTNQELTSQTTQVLTEDFVTLRTVGKIAQVVINGTANGTTFAIVPSGYRPSINSTAVGRYKATNGTYYPCLLTVATNGGISASYWDGSTARGISEGTVVCTGTWIIP